MMGGHDSIPIVCRPHSRVWSDVRGSIKYVASAWKTIGTPRCRDGRRWYFQALRHQGGVF
jgi:hypothetical protein